MASEMQSTPLPVAGRLAVLTLAACGPGDAPASPSIQIQPRFGMTDVAEELGLRWSSRSGGAETTQLLEVKGGGLAIFDTNADGRFDVFVPGGATLASTEQGQGARLFRQTAEGRFEDATEGSGLGLARWGFGCAVGDVNGDGHEDLFVACFGRNALFLGQSDGGFVDGSEAASLDREAWSSSGAFGDLDGDGDLDLYVVNYVQFDPASLPAPMEFRGAKVFGGPMGLPGEPDRVYENLGEGRFRDATADWGFGAAQPSYGLGVVIADLDGDGSAEVLVGNDSQANFLFQRGEDGRFLDAGSASGLALDENGWGQATMGIALGDVNDDGMPDVFSSNFMSDHDTLHVNQGGLRFEDRSRRSGLSMVSMPYLGWGCDFADIDQDGLQELLVVHGHVYPESVTAPMGWRTDQEIQLFERDGKRLRVVPPSADLPWLGETNRDRGAAFADMDGDGDLDLLVRELVGPLRLYRNDGPTGNWLRIVLRDRRPGSSNTTGIGAQVRVQSAGAAQHRWIVSGTSYQSASPAEAHFGLGAETGPVQVEVTWPGGEIQTTTAQPNQRLEITHP